MSRLRFGQNTRFSKATIGNVSHWTSSKVSAASMPDARIFATLIVAHDATSSGVSVARYSSPSTPHRKVGVLLESPSRILHPLKYAALSPSLPTTLLCLACGPSAFSVGRASPAPTSKVFASRSTEDRVLPNEQESHHGQRQHGSDAFLTAATLVPLAATGWACHC